MTTGLALIGRVAFLMVLGLGVWPSTTLAAGVSASFAMDATEYSIGEPVFVAVQVRNDSRTPFRDLAFLHPAAGWLILKLERDGQSVKWSGYLDNVFSQEGPTLMPGESFCEIVELGEWFGEDVQAIGLTN